MVPGIPGHILLGRREALIGIRANGRERVTRRPALRVAIAFREAVPIGESAVATAGIRERTLVRDLVPVRDSGAGPAAAAGPADVGGSGAAGDLGTVGGPADTGKPLLIGGQNVVGQQAAVGVPDLVGAWPAQDRKCSRGVRLKPVVVRVPHANSSVSTLSDRCVTYRLNEGYVR